MPSIKQIPGAHRLPDFRNLGVMLRLLLGVNLMALAALLLAQDGTAGPRAFLSSRPGRTATAGGDAPAGAAARRPVAFAAYRRRGARAVAGDAAGGDAGGFLALHGPGRWRLAAGAAWRAARAAAGIDARLLPAARRRPVAGDRRGAAAGADRAHPPALPVQQPQRRALADSRRAEARRACAGRTGRPLPCADARQPRSGAARRRNRALPPVSRPRKLRLGERLNVEWKSTTCRAISAYRR